MTSYCPACLDVWNLAPGRVMRRDWVYIWPGVRMHITCGQALAAICPPQRWSTRLR
jgi:hypothetical protein